jgi:hypothetical protein
MLSFIGYLFLLIAASGVWLAAIVYIKPLADWAHKNTMGPTFEWPARLALGAVIPALAFLVLIEGIVEHGLNADSTESLKEVWRGAVYGIE